MAHEQILENYSMKYYDGGIFGIIDSNKSYTYTFFCQSPTSNCQVASAAGMDLIFDHFDDNFCRNLIILAKKSFAKRMLIVDVNKKYHSRVKGTFKNEDFKIEKEYLSTNGSEMCMYLINIENL